MFQIIFTNQFKKDYNNIVYPYNQIICFGLRYKVNRTFNVEEHF